MCSAVLREKQFKHSNICCRVAWRCPSVWAQEGRLIMSWKSTWNLVVKQRSQALSFKTSCSLYTVSGMIEKGHNDCCFFVVIHCLPTFHWNYVQACRFQLTWSEREWERQSLRVSLHSVITEHLFMLNLRSCVFSCFGFIGTLLDCEDERRRKWRRRGH